MNETVNVAWRNAARLAGITAMAAALTLGAAGNRKIGKTGKRLPVWIRMAVKELSEESRSYQACPGGCPVSIGDITLVHSYEEMRPAVSAAQYEFIANRRAPSFVRQHRFPIYLIGESPDVEFLEWLARRGMEDQAALLTKAILSHEAMHVCFDPARGLTAEEQGRLTAEEFERRHEVAAYELQLSILKRDLAAGKFAPLYKSLGSDKVDLTTVLEERLAALKSGAPMSQFGLFGTRGTAP